MDDDATAALERRTKAWVAAGKKRRFEAWCASLKRNDPAVTDVIEVFDLTNQKALHFGEALQGNTHVSKLYLTIGHLLEEGGDDANDSVTLLLRFIRKSRALREIRLSGHTVSVSILRRFFLAIAENPANEYLVLCGRTLQPEGFDVLMKTTQSLKVLSFSPCDFVSMQHETNWQKR
jgi:hypothetical protein